VIGRRASIAIRQAADAFTNAPMHKRAALRAARIALQPLVVLMKSVCPACACPKALGLFPKSKPGGGRQFSSPQSSLGWSKFLAAFIAAVLSGKMRISRTPAARAAAIVVVARRTSKTTTVRSRTWDSVRSAGRRTTSTGKGVAICPHDSRPVIVKKAASPDANCPASIAGQFTSTKSSWVLNQNRSALSRMLPGRANRSQDSPWHLGQSFGGVTAPSGSNPQALH